MNHPHPPSPGQPGPVSQAPRPGWIELIVGLVVMALAAYALPPVLITPLDLSAATLGVLSGVVSGGAGLLAFAAAALVRVRSWSAFGVRRTTWRWLLLGVAGGFLALVAKLVTVPLFTALFNVETDTQASYVAGAAAGTGFLVLMLLALAVITPIGEEILFRGVVATVLLRYGAVIGVVGSSVVFALAHGINVVLPSALIVGLIAAELYRRSGSIWPGVIVHAVNNAIGIALFALASLAT